jgi:hypothetical protein
MSSQSSNESEEFLDAQESVSSPFSAIFEDASEVWPSGDDGNSTSELAQAEDLIKMAEKSTQIREMLMSTSHSGQIF